MKNKINPKQKEKYLYQSKPKIFYLYFGWRLRIIMEKTTERLRGPFRTHKQYFMTSLLLILIISSTLIIRNYYFSKAATYTWHQDSWNTETTNTAIHPTNQEEWTEYQSADPEINFSTPGEISISSSTETLTHTTDDDFSNGTQQGVLITGDEITLDLP